MCRHDGRKHRDCAGRLQVRSFMPAVKVQAEFWTAKWDITIRDRDSNRAKVIGPVPTQALLGDAAKAVRSEAMKRLADQMALEWNKHTAHLLQGEQNGRYGTERT